MLIGLGDDHVALVQHADPQVPPPRDGIEARGRRIAPRLVRAFTNVLGDARADRALLDAHHGDEAERRQHDRDDDEDRADAHRPQSRDPRPEPGT